MKDDANEVLSRLGATNRSLTDATTRVTDSLSVRFPSRWQYRNFRKVLEELKTVPKLYLEQLVEKYAIDMELFGYDFDAETRTASCGINTADGRVCC